MPEIERSAVGMADAPGHDSQSQELRSRLAVVIINFRTPTMVLDCLGTLDGQVDPGRDRVIVVDNASGDGSADVIRAGIQARGWGGWAKVIDTGCNGGFSAGNNVGIRACDAEFYLLLNSDTLVRPEAIAGLLQAAAEHSEAGLIGPRLEDPDGSAQSSAFRRIRPISELVRGARTGFVDRLFPSGVVAMKAGDAGRVCEWISFACVLVRGTVLKRVGPMDEAMFMYFEDTDYGVRATKVGVEVWYDPRARVVHLGGGSGAMKRDVRPPKFYYAARARYFFKHYGRSGWILANILWSLGRLIFVANSVVTGRIRRVELVSLADVWISRCDTPAGVRGARSGYSCSDWAEGVRP